MEAQAPNDDAQGDFLGASGAVDSAGDDDFVLMRALETSGRPRISTWIVRVASAPRVTYLNLSYV
jgi:hypothetical protein